MGGSFAPNHKGMPALSEGHDLDFLRKQVLTSRNVQGGPWVDFVLGGLNYQIERPVELVRIRPAVCTLSERRSARRPLIDENSVAVFRA
jgi:hypothetical protein